MLSKDTDERVRIAITNNKQPEKQAAPPVIQPDKQIIPPTIQPVKEEKKGFFGKLFK